MPFWQSCCWQGEVCGYNRLTMGEASQNLPENSGGHLQVYSLIPSTQVPPFYMFELEMWTLRILFSSKIFTEPYLTHVTDAIVVINGTVFSTETKGALASIVIAAIHASSAVFARIELFGTELDLLFAVSSCQIKTKLHSRIWSLLESKSLCSTRVSDLAIAAIRFHLIDTGCIVNTFVIKAVINVGLATIAFIAGWAVTTKLMKNSTHYDNWFSLKRKGCRIYLKRPSSKTLQMAELRHGLP